MKKSLLVLFAMALCTTGFAQKTVVKSESFSDTQARMVEVTARSYVRPLIVDMVVAKGTQRKVYKKSYGYTEFKVAMGANPDNLRSRVIYDATTDWNCDAVVAATFKIELSPDGQQFDVEMKGFPGNFDPQSWHPMNQGDFEWFDRVNKAGTVESSQEGTVIQRVKK